MLPRCSHDPKPTFDKGLVTGQTVFSPPEPGLFFSRSLCLIFDASLTTKAAGGHGGDEDAWKTKQKAKQRMYGRIDGWMVGWMAGWLDGWMAGWLDGRIAGWLDGWMASWLDGWMAGWLDGWMAGWLDGWMDGTPVAWTKWLEATAACVGRGRIKS